MFESLLEKITDYLPARKINGFKGEPYLERCFLFRLLGITAYIHRFVASDPDRNLHDHPWGWGFSIILQGQYQERYLKEHQEVTRIIKWFNWIPGYRYHRVEVTDKSKPVWTLFIHGPRVKGWGFMEPGITNDGNLLNYEHAFYMSSPNPDWHKSAQKGDRVKQYRQ